ncbi:MAG: toxin-antitoxin system YwqK family antitoxin [Bacteroidetes bacterium]|nr:toxin-antitoxin system YwqK family antitoxin [Bacteroidota bacterium]
MTRNIVVLVVAALLLASCSRTKTEYWPNGNKKSEIHTDGDKYEGAASYWYDDGTLQNSCNYRNNLVDGVLRSYYPSGRIQAEQYFTGGKLNGTVKSWDKEGNLQSEAHYRNDVIHGRYAEYYENKALKLEGNYLDGDHEGLWLYYDPSGMIVGEGNFTRGTGVQKSFYENGTTKQLTHYTKNKKDGEEVFFKPDGSPDVVNVFVLGKLVNKIKK